MKFIGFSFTGVNISKNSEVKPGLKMQTTVDIDSVKSTKADIIKPNEDLLEVSFAYKVKYEPGIAEVGLKGMILVSLAPKDAKDIMKKWKKKELPNDFRIPIINVVMRKAGLKALSLEDEMNLPLHLPLPSLKNPEEKDKK